MVLPAAFFSGCSVGQVVPPFTPQETNPEPYYPEPIWSANTDPTLLALQALKRLTGETMPPGSGTKAASAAGTTSGTTPGGVTPQPTPVPGPGPGPGPAPPTPTPLSPAIWTISGYVKDRISGNNIAGATILLINDLGVTVDSVATDSSGYYFFRDKPNVLPPSFGLNQVIASKSGYSQIPFSSRYFFFDGTSQSLGTLELAMLIPALQKEAGDYVSYSGVVAKLYFYVGSPQKVYYGALFNSKDVWPYDPDPDPPPDPPPSTLGTVTYEFTLFSPADRDKYTIDSLQFTCPDPWKFEPSTVLWTSGGNVTVGCIDSDTKSTIDDDSWNNKSASETFYLPPVAYDPTTGKVVVRVTNIADQQLLLTYVKLTYDYHKKP